MKTPIEAGRFLKANIKKEWKTAFLSAFFIGLLIHLPVMLGDYPNHDGLASMYFDQNMITSGRWFLSVACGISSYFTLPWVIGLISLVFLGLAAAVLMEFLEIREPAAVILLSGLLVSFPALASTYAYIFTADGYMLGLCLAFLAPAFAKKSPRGFIPGGISLAFSMGIYQSYLPFAVLLSIYGCIMFLFSEQGAAEKLKGMLRYLYMGIIGAGLYYLILQILLKIQGKKLDTYQGISGMASTQKASFYDMLVHSYHDFIAFTGKGNVLYNNIFSFVACGILIITVVIILLRLALQKRYVRKWYFYVILLAIAVILPVATNLVLWVSPEVTYHLLMRYQWILYPILAFAFIWNYGFQPEKQAGNFLAALQWAALAAVFVLVVNYGVTDNIAYSNLEKKYEKTYAYCLRMADRMEQTEGYYTGMPVAMIGVQSKENLPETDITNKITSGMIGMTGDYLVYTDNNYQSFMKHYLGVTINLVPDEEMERIYKTEEYQALHSFPEEGSMKVVDGILYIKTE